MNDVEKIIMKKLNDIEDKVDKIGRLEERIDSSEKRIHHVEHEFSFVYETVIGAVILALLTLLF